MGVKGEEFNRPVKARSDESHGVGGKSERGHCIVRFHGSAGTGGRNTRGRGFGIVQKGVQVVHDDFSPRPSGKEGVCDATQSTEKR